MKQYEYRKRARWILDSPRVMQHSDAFVVRKCIDFGLDVAGINPVPIHDVYNAVIAIMFEDEIEISPEHDDPHQCRGFVDFMEQVPMDKIPQNSIWGKTSFIVAILMEQGLINYYDKNGTFVEGVQQPPDPESMRQSIELVQSFDLDDPGDSWMIKTAGMDAESIQQLVFTADSSVRKLIDKINVIGELDFSAHSGAKVQSYWKRSRVGEHMRTERVRTPVDVIGLPAHELIRPDLDERIIMGKVFRTSFFQKHTDRAKQLIVMLIDDSGSMSDVWKMAYVRATLMECMAKVVRGDAILYVATFEENLDPFTMVEDQDDCDYLIDHFFGFNRGWTNIENVIEQASRQLNAGELKGEVRMLPFEGIDPQILIVNDGDDTIDASYVPPIPTHAITLGNYNADLEKVCRASGGQYTKIS